MSFFDPPPPPPELPEFPPQPLEGRYLPGVVAIERVLARSDDGAIALRALHVYPDGIEIQLESYLRDRNAEGAPFGAMGFTHFAQVSLRAAETVVEETHEVIDLDAAADEPDSDEPEARPPTPAFGGPAFRPFPRHFHTGHDLNFGVQFPDGTKVTTFRPYVPDFDFSDDASDVPRYGLDGGGGGGSNTHYEHSFFLWPLPGPGTLTLVCEWATVGISETVVELDMQPILDAARRAQTIWDEDAGLPSHHNSIATAVMMREHAKQMRNRQDPPEED
jgi:hypothetical protein